MGSMTLEEHKLIKYVETHMMSEKEKRLVKEYADDRFLNVRPQCGDWFLEPEGVIRKISRVVNNNKVMFCEDTEDRAIIMGDNNGKPVSVFLGSAILMTREMNKARLVAWCESKMRTNETGALVYMKVPVWCIMEEENQ